MKILGSILFAVILASGSFKVFANAQTNEEVKISEITGNLVLSKDERSQRLILLYNSTSDEKTKSLVISEMTSLVTKTNFRFLIDEYPNVSDDKKYGVFAKALQAHYEFFKNNTLDPDLLLLNAQYKEIYGNRLADTNDPNQLNAAIDQIHDVYEIEDAYEFLKQLDPNNPEYRKKYADQMLITLIVTDRNEELIEFVRAMDICEYRSHGHYLYLTQIFGTLSHEKFEELLEELRSKSDGHNCHN